MRLLLITCIVLGALAGCHGSADIQGDGYRVKTSTYPNGDAPRHCPPGHAKKGWC
jgi:hypothetical protein